MHGTQLHKYKLLAFICSIKRYRKNSIIYGNEKKYIIARSIGISPLTYSKYLTECLRAGIATKTPWGHYQFVGLADAVNILFEDLKTWKYRRFFRENTYTTFKSFYDTITFSILKQNICQQTYKNTVTKTQSAIKELTGFTGKFHLSGLIGCSPSTALRRLRNWAKNRVKRYVNVKTYSCEVTHATFDLIKSITNKPIFVVKGVFTQVIGSKIVL